MVDITPLIRSDSRVIQGYSAGSIRVSGALYTKPICVTVSSVTEWSGDIADLSFGDENSNIELVLIGLSRVDGPLPQMTRDKLRARGWSIEVMEIGAACRTYNVLMADGRNVGVALQI